MYRLLQVCLVRPPDLVVQLVLAVRPALKGLVDRFRRALPEFLVFLAYRLHHVVLVHLLVLVVLPRRFHLSGPGVPSDQAHHVDL